MRALLKTGGFVDVEIVHTEHDAFDLLNDCLKDFPDQVVKWVASRDDMEAMERAARKRTTVLVPGRIEVASYAGIPISWAMQEVW